MKAEPGAFRISARLMTVLPFVPVARTFTFGALEVLASYRLCREACSSISAATVLDFEPTSRSFEPDGNIEEIASRSLEIVLPFRMSFWPAGAICVASSSS